MKTKKVATTVKIESSLYNELKILGIRHKMSLQRIVEKTVYRYVNEESFRNEMNNYSLPLSVIKPPQINQNVINSPIELTPVPSNS